ncbi:MAG: 4Fe-4S dicluster domain-containing protein [Clostridiales bacterium]|nr:4Fe-4S dicluster domain-containing protein [Clostridiales bacterium]
MNKELQVKLLNLMSNTDAKKCMKCGKCTGRCPSYDEMDLKPHQFVSLIAQGKIDKLMESKSIWVCLSCMACVERCPRGVAPANVIEAVRDTIIKEQGNNGVKAEDIPPIIDETVPQQLLVAAYRKYNR